MTTKTELLPCPFCGGEAHKAKTSGDERDGYADRVSYICWACGCSQTAVGDTRKGGYADNSTVEARALEAWNTRAPVEAPQVESEAVAWGPYFVDWLGPCVWAGIREEMAPELVGKQVWVSTQKSQASVTVLPGRLPSHYSSARFFAGYNAAIDKTAKLNAKPIPIELLKTICDPRGRDNVSHLFVAIDELRGLIK